ncbi:MAG TPA: hypothetical protein VJH92_01750 [Candidatus Nanoarchaeia archaeon]|nr:hypothetical protein [Candidatus Nanoarchaeia archaeon]
MEKELENKILKSMQFVVECPTAYNCEWDKSEFAGFIDAKGSYLTTRGFKPTLGDKLLFKKMLE